MTVIIDIPSRKQTVTISGEPSALTVSQLARFLHHLIEIEPRHMRFRQKYQQFIDNDIVSGKRLTLNPQFTDRSRNYIVNPITICGKRVGPFKDMNVDFQNPSINHVDIIDFDPRMIDCIIAIPSTGLISMELYQEEEPVDIKVEEIGEQGQYLYIITFKPIPNKKYRLHLKWQPQIENLEFIFREWKLKPTNFFSDIDIY